MNKRLKFIFLELIIFLCSASAITCNTKSCNTNCYNNSYPRSIFVPRQLSYNPILENAILLYTKKHEDWGYIFSVKSIYTQSVGSKFQSYFNIYEKGSLNIQENNSGDVNPLWLNPISSNDSFYSSCLSFCPKRQTYGSMIYFAANFSHGFELAINTAIVGAKNNMHVYENNIKNLGTHRYETLTKSLTCYERFFGKICDAQTRTGLDDIQIKLSYSYCKSCMNHEKENSHKDTKECYNFGKNTSCPIKEKRFIGSVYGLLGIPTGAGSKAEYLFEPLIGSNHAQLGFGADMSFSIKDYDCGSWSLLGEAKYRYAFSAQECRSFDLCKNGQWSRYMLFVNETDKYATYPAINDLTFKADVTPGSSLDIYLATHANHNAWNFELGYDFWYRSCEKVNLCCKNFPTNVGVADLLGIAKRNPQSASTANISQGVQIGTNQMVSDATFVPVTLSDINLISGAQKRDLSNSFYGSIGYKFETKSDHKILLGLNTSYELGSCNTPDNITAWLNLDFYI